jgi:apolipoprotein N-acyltransferase
MSFIGRCCRAWFPSLSELRLWASPLAGCAVSGLLFRLAFPRFEYFPLAFVAMAPFLFHLPNSARKKAFWLGGLFGFCFFYTNLLWLNTLTYVNPAAPLGVLFMTLVYSVPMGLLVILVARVWRGDGSLVRFLFVPSVWVAYEYLRAQSEWGFPWFYLGHTQAAFLPMIQIADLAGAYGVSFVLVCVNTALVELWLWARRRRLAASAVYPIFPIRPIAFSFALLAATLIYGFIQASNGDESDPSRQLRVALIQPGTPQEMKMASYDYGNRAEAERLQEALNRKYIDAMLQTRAQREAAGKPLPELYILPESAVTHPFFNWSPRHTEMVEDWSKRLGAPVFFGANRFQPPDGVDQRNERFLGEAKSFNSAWLVTPDGGLDPRAYDKMHLVPFGEYGSYMDFIPGFTEYILGIGNFTPGAGAQRYEIRGSVFGCLICFESCFPYLVREYMSERTDWLLIITNDAWYKYSSGALRHKTQSIFRAVESRRPIVRVASTGVSCLVDSRGRILESLPLLEGKVQTAVVDVPIADGSARTLYMRPYGEWLSWLCLIFPSGMLLVLRLREPRAGGATNREPVKSPPPARKSKKRNRG